MLARMIKYMMALISFSLGCIGIYDNCVPPKIEEEMRVEETYNLELEKENEDIRLSIPKLALNRVLYPLGDLRNNLDQNIIFIEGTSMPDEEGGNVIIVGHSGNSDISYFKDVHKLNIGDIFHIKYNGTNYRYEIAKRYLVEKTGKVEIVRDRRKNTATLITCYGKDKQIVVIAYRKE